MIRKRKNEIKKEKMKFTLLLVVIFQILLLMNIAAAHSYFIYQIDSSLNESKIIKDKNKIIDFVLDLFLKFLKIKQIGIVSASDDVAWNCCLEMNDGSICQDIASVASELCAVPALPTKCEQVSECEKGCCLDSVEGLCTTGATKQKCINDGGEWSDDEHCLIPECQKACCVLGSNSQFVTEQRCNWLSSKQGFEKDFRDLKTEPECLSLSASQFKGACLLQGTCSLKTEEGCLLNAGNFYKDYLCSHPSLNTNCEKQTSIGCIGGENEIYWFDSCGNRENIYSSNRDVSWNNGKLLSKEESCNSNSANINSKTCGNCGLSGVCSETTGETHVEDGDFVCKDLKCRYKDSWGNNVIRENGESWCIYDSYIGDGKDVVGSRHWKHLCVNGEIKVEQCADYRGQVCAQTEIQEDGKIFSMASCVMNEAQLCISYNDNEDTMQDKCNENKHCMIKNINIDKSFYFDMCVPRYPRGFVLSEPSLSCSMANQKCSVFYEKDWKGKWKCKENCNCEEIGFTEQMNDLCISLGDCGSYINYAGQGTDNIKVTGAPEISWTDYKDYAKPVMDQHVEPQDIDGFLSSMIGDSGGYNSNEENDLSRAVEFLGTLGGGLGTAIFGISALTTTTTTMGGYTITTGLTSGSIGAGIGAFASATVGAALGMYAGAWLAKSFDRTGDAALVLTVSGGVAGGVAGYLAASSASFFAEAGLLGISAFGWTIIIVAVIILYTIFVGWGETKEKIIEFECHPWQAPVGEANCEKCNEDPLKPCTKYRCKSLGQVCKLLNEDIDAENPTCESIPYEVNPPVITPEEVLTEEYEFRNEETKRVEIRGINGGCIQEWTPVLFTLNTNEHAQCKYGFQKTDPNYEDMGDNYPVEQNRFTTNHTFGFMMPSLDSFSVYNVSGNLKEMFGNMNMYLRCQDAWGNFNLDEYVVNFCINSGPDETAAWIRKYTPKDGSFLAYGINETLLKIYLNEPAECKYDFVKGKTYDEMVNEMSCRTELINTELDGWPCSTTLTNLANENKIYIKCKDKPWIQTQEDINKYGERNINQQDFVYSLYISESELKIDSVLPKGKVESGFEPVSIDLEVETSGGVDNGKSVCYYEWAGNWVQFFDTFSDSHKQRGLNLMGGNFNIPIKCQDEAGNIDYKNANFNIIVDSSPPMVVRAYNSAGNLKLITDEEAECYYDFNRCNFNIDNASSMTIALSTQHTADWISEQTYYVKCKDIWGNANPSCAIIVKPSSIN